AELARATQVAAQRTAAHAAVQRARLALALAAHPNASHAELGAQVGLRPTTVYKWRRRWATHGFSLTDAPRSGRPRAFSPGGRGDRHRVGL
ncbi:MAG: helix-turn-helix domain-containing protein, partial [Armatimonadetes bacterium]|nr:helix-turn-helix domain-containing protein [Armatimonadota bacterium]